MLKLAPIILILSPIELEIPRINDHIPYESLYETFEPNESSLEYNYITTEKYLKKILKEKLILFK